MPTGVPQKKEDISSIHTRQCPTQQDESSRVHDFYFFIFFRVWPLAYSPLKPFFFLFLFPEKDVIILFLIRNEHHYSRNKAVHIFPYAREYSLYIKALLFLYYAGIFPSVTVINLLFIKLKKDVLGTMTASR